MVRRWGREPKPGRTGSASSAEPSAVSDAPLAAGPPTAVVSDVPPAEVARRRRRARRKAQPASSFGATAPAPAAEVAPALTPPIAEAPPALEQAPTAQSPMAAPPEAAPGAVAAEAGTRASLAEAPSKGDGGWRRRLGPKQVAAAVLVLLAAEIGYVVHLNTSPSSSPQKTAAPPPPLSTLPSTTTPSSSPTTAPAAPSAAGAPRTAAASAKPATAASTASATRAPVGYCTADDLDFTTTTDSSTYSPGQTVNMTMAVTDVRPCIFQPEAVGAYDCPSTLFVSRSGSQVFPSSGEGESCDPPSGQTMNPGSEEAVSVGWVIPSDWDQTNAPGSSCQAVGEWGWSAGPGQSPDTITIGSQLFTIS